MMKQMLNNHQRSFRLLETTKLRWVENVKIATKGLLFLSFRNFLRPHLKAYSMEEKLYLFAIMSFVKNKIW